jgi:radical SAM protein with 4Fe4S-binding SPASM domain
LSIHGGGEPLLGEQIDYFINVARENNIMLHMNSTGFFLRPELSEKLLRWAKLSIRFSIHAGKNKTYAKIMGHDLEEVKNNIKYLIQRNSEIGNKDNEFWFSYIVMKENINEITDFLRLANELGIRQVRFMKLTPNRLTIKGVLRKEDGFKFRHCEQFNSEIKKEFIRILPQIKDLARQLNINIEPGDLEFECAKVGFIDNAIAQQVFRKIWPVDPEGFCIAPWIGGCVINQNGDVYLCCGMPCIIGNLFRQDFEEIWNSARMQGIRRRFMAGYLLKDCRGCRTVRLEEYPRIVAKEFKERLVL